MDCLNLAYDIEDQVRLQSALSASGKSRQQRSVPILGSGSRARGSTTTQLLTEA